MITKEDIACIAIRILSLYCLLSALGAVPSIIGISMTDSRTGTVYFLPLLLTALFGIVLWVYAIKLSQYMIFDTAIKKESTNNSLIDSIEYSIVMLTGLIIVVYTIPYLVGFVYFFYHMRQNPGIDYSQSVRSIWVMASKLVLGILPIINSRAIVEFMHKLQKIKYIK